MNVVIAIYIYIYYIGTELERAWWRSLPEVPYVAVVKLFGRELQPGRCRCGNAWLLLESPASDSRTDGGGVVEAVVPPWSEGNLIVVVVVAGGMFHCSTGLVSGGGQVAASSELMAAWSEPTEISLVPP